AHARLQRTLARVDQLDRRRRLARALGAAVNDALGRRFEPQQPQLADTMAAPPRGERVLVEHADVDRRDRVRRPFLPRPYRLGPGEPGRAPAHVVGGWSNLHEGNLTRLSGLVTWRCREAKGSCA